MITRDEEHCIGRCLSSVRDFVDEMIVVDTGSADSTPNIAAHLAQLASMVMAPATVAATVIISVSRFFI